MSNCHLLSNHDRAAHSAARRPTVHVDLDAERSGETDAVLPTDLDHPARTVPPHRGVQIWTHVDVE